MCGHSYTVGIMAKHKVPGGIPSRHAERRTLEETCSAFPSDGTHAPAVASQSASSSTPASSGKRIGRWAGPRRRGGRPDGALHKRHRLLAASTQGRAQRRSGRRQFERAAFGERIRFGRLAPGAGHASTAGRWRSLPRKLVDSTSVRRRKHGCRRATEWALQTPGSVRHAASPCSEPG
jgi:hypothetical protein